jgi:3-deoxy-D-arabino-heptulosonate 7-phosphate (DAHP) synthase class II
VILTPNIAGLSKPRFSKSISTPIPTNGAAKNPSTNKREGNSTARTRICFCEISAPTRTPNNIKLIAETHRIKMSNSLPRTLESLRSNKDRQTMKANVHIHKSFVRFMVFAKSHSFGGLFKTMDTFNELVHSQNNPFPIFGFSFNFSARSLSWTTCKNL